MGCSSYLSTVIYSKSSYIYAYILVGVNTLYRKALLYTALYSNINRSPDEPRDAGQHTRHVCGLPRNVGPTLSLKRERGTKVAVRSVRSHAFALRLSHTAAARAARGTARHAPLISLMSHVSRPHLCPRGPGRATTTLMAAQCEAQGRTRAPRRAVTRSAQLHVGPASPRAPRAHPRIQRARVPMHHAGCAPRAG